MMSTQVSTEDVSIEENESSQSLPELDDEAPFELRALEAVLRTCTLRLDAACEEVEPVAEETMRELQTARQVALASLERLRHVKNAVSHLEARPELQKVMRPPPSSLVACASACSTSTFFGSGGWRRRARA